MSQIPGEIIKKFDGVINEFFNFIIQNKLTSLFIVAVTGFAISQLISSIKTNLIDYYIIKYADKKYSNFINLGVSFLQFLFIIIVLYIFYRIFLKRIEKFNKTIDFDEINWKKEILKELSIIRDNLNRPRQ